MIDLTGITDKPLQLTMLDQFKVGPHIKGLAQFIEMCDTPLTIALQGDWGTGKTSFINMLRECLNPFEYYKAFLIEEQPNFIGQLEACENREQEINLVKQSMKTYLNGINNHQSVFNVEKSIYETKIHTILFNTWRYSQFSGRDDLSISFLSYIVDEFSKVLKLEEKTKIKQLFSNVKDVLVRNKESILGTVTSAITSSVLGNEMVIPQGQAENVPMTTHEKFRHYDQASAIEELKSLLTITIDKYIKQTGADRLIIFIDDLDRLVPSVALNLLEIIKLFLDVKNCVFVLAIDYEVVTEGISSKFGANLSKEKGRSFFDKMIQLPFRIPTEFYQYDELILNSIQKQISDAYIEEVTKMIQLTIGNNPRAVKRLLNSYQLILNISQSIEGQSERKIEDEKDKVYLMIAICIQLSYQEVYMQLCDLRTNYKKLFELTGFSEEESGSQTAIVSSQKNAYTDLELQNLFGQKLENALDETEIRKIRMLIHTIKKRIAAIEGIEVERLSESDLDGFLSAINYARITSNTSSDDGAEEFYTLKQKESDVIKQLKENKKITTVKFNGQRLESPTFTKLFIFTLEQIAKDERVESLLHDIDTLIDEVKARNHEFNPRLFIPMYKEKLNLTKDGKVFSIQQKEKMLKDYEENYLPTKESSKRSTKFQRNVIHLKGQPLEINTKFTLSHLLTTLYEIVAYIGEKTGENYLEKIELGLKTMDQLQKEK